MTREIKVSDKELARRLGMALNDVLTWPDDADKIVQGYGLSMWSGEWHVIDNGRKPRLAETRRDFG